MDSHLTSRTDVAIELGYEFCHVSYRLNNSIIFPEGVIPVHYGSLYHSVPLIFRYVLIIFISI